jgi:predicted Rossmann fold flavoprotein
MSLATEWDVVVVGAGAAGLMAAIAAAEQGRRVLLLEKTRRPGVKILMSGGTRCNLTHATDNRGIVKAYGPPGKFLHSALASFSVQDTIDFFEAEGVATKVEDTGKVFPVSNRAVDVLDALLRRLERSGARLSLEEPVTGLVPGSGGLMLTTARRTIEVGRVILTTGGQSYPGSGTTGDGYRLTQELGHTILSPRPALVPITVAPSWVAELRGITLPTAGIRLLEGTKVLGSGIGSLLFAHFGLSGPVILDLSRLVSGHAAPRSLTLELDLLPGTTETELDAWLRQESQASAKKQLAVVLAGSLPRRLAEQVVCLAGLAAERKAAALSRNERQQLVAALKHLPLPVTGTLGFGKAEVTAGGVCLEEVDSRTMESRKRAGMYLAGELLDLDGPIGGYNFQAAWSTGWLAGNAAARQ